MEGHSTQDVYKVKEKNPVMSFVFYTYPSRGHYHPADFSRQRMVRAININYHVTGLSTLTFIILEKQPDVIYVWFIEYVQVNANYRTRFFIFYFFFITLFKAVLQSMQIYTVKIIFVFWGDMEMDGLCHG